jgi:phosphoglycerate dehydrogenase-like enzyme
MPTSKDHKEMADRLVQLAIACTAPSVAEALMALALDHMRQVTALNELTVASQQKQSTEQDQAAGYGD